VAHACNLSYTEGKDQEDNGSKPTGENSSQNPILKTQKGLVEWFKW
jgi:hypothetical protein